MLNVLTIAGSDPSSGAGIQGDIKTFEALGVYGLSAVTAVTSQSNLRFYRSEPVPPEMVRSQIRSIISDFKIDAVKIGMVYDRKTIMVIHDELKGVAAPVVLDPIFESSTGGVLLQGNALRSFIRMLIPLADVITPNIPEAEKITGTRIGSLSSAKKAAMAIRELGAKNVVIKGGHMPGRAVTDLLLEHDRFFAFSQKRFPRESHGGGCIFSATLCANMAKGMSVKDSVQSAQRASLESIRRATRIGPGLAVARKNGTDKIEEELLRAIRQFAAMGNAYKHIPEVQTNFVYSKPGPRDIFDIMGLEGRIIRTGDSATPVGALKYGGSRHVGSAVLEITKKFPSTRSCINMRYDRRTVEKAAARGLRVASYDRSLEPARSKEMDGRTISWGVRSAISSLRSPPDMIYHTGDIGKEPMILLFGRDPKNVMAKFAKIA